MAAFWRTTVFNLEQLIVGCWPLPDIRQIQKANHNTGHSDLKYF
jgi:hypothetical protein